MTKWMAGLVGSAGLLGLLGPGAAVTQGSVRAAPPAGVSRAPVVARRDTAPALRLTNVVEAALRSHPRAAGAAARLDAARAEVGQARSELYPTLATAATGTRYEKPMVVAPLHGFDPRTPPAFDETLYQAHASAGYTLFDGGARRARIRAAEAGETAAVAATAAARDEVVAEATAVYLSSLAARDLLRAHRQQVEALEAERERASLLLSQGKAPRLAVLRAEAALSEARAGLEAADQQLRLALHRLVRVSGLPPDRVVAEALVDVAPTAESLPDRDALVAMARESNPRLREAEERAAAAETGVKAARSSFFPTIELSGRYSAFGAESTDPALEWQAGVQVSYPLFTGGARSSGVDRARAEAEAARSEAELADRSVADAVDAALVAYESARARTDALEAAVAQSTEVVRIEALALASGAGTQTDYLQAEAALLRARAGLAEARYAVVEARVRLAQATGRLDPEWLQRWTEEVER